jgi:hypothetical protein
MNESQKLQLQKMITANNVEDTTALIRSLNHSGILRNNVNKLLELKAKYPTDESQLHAEAMAECSFLFTYYTDIYNKIRKDEIDLEILFNAFDILKDIEDNKIDQHEGAFAFGNLLKQIYVDSALRKAEKINATTGESELVYKGPQVDITWSKFKHMQQHK